MGGRSEKLKVQRRDWQISLACREFGGKRPTRSSQFAEMECYLVAGARPATMGKVPNLLAISRRLYSNIKFSAVSTDQEIVCRQCR